MILTKYGPPDALELQDIPKPVPKDDEVLVKIKAASLNAADWHLMRGSPFLMRMMFGGILKPKFRILGADVAGTVEAAGRGIAKFKSGDDVFGDISVCGWGAYAEYVTATEKALVKKPAGLTFEQAAAVPLAAVTALQALRDSGNIQSGQKVLVNGASGGVGTFAVQIAKYFGAEVTAVCSTEKVELTQSLGPDFVIDYKKTDITREGKSYDLIFDGAAFRSTSDYKRILNPGGRYVLIGGSTSQAMKMMAFGGLISMGSGKKFGSMMAKPNTTDLEFIKGLLETSKVKPVIDRRYKLAEVRDAIRYLEEGHARGKIIITV
jgi:NADPH:quinone reductase-like Zn-dependent oxidoreductase